MRWRRALSFIGRCFITVGLLILLFVAYQLWGTGVYEARQQHALKKSFLAAAAAAKPPVTGPGTPTTTPPEPETPAGGAIAIIKIPRIGLDRAVVEGVGIEDLRKGPGHYPKTALPGQPGNAAIAGHRTTYGAPFNRLDELSPGDPIEVTTLQATFVYRMAEARVVSPTQVDVLRPSSDPVLTLTTCNPKYSARQRLVVIARLESTVPTAPPTTPTTTPTTAPATSTSLGSTTTTRSHGVDIGPLAGAGLSGERPTTVVTGLWGLAAAIVGGLWWFAFRRRRRFTTWIAGLVPFLAVLFFFYANLERVLPGNI